MNHTRNKMKICFVSKQTRFTRHDIVPMSGVILVLELFLYLELISNLQHNTRALIGQEVVLFWN